MYFWQLLFVSLGNIYNVYCTSQTAREFCRNLKMNIPGVQRGEIQFHTKGKNITLFCEFNDLEGYTFYPKSHVNEIADVEVDHVLIRHLRSNNLQFETRMEPISIKNNVPLSVQYNEAEYFTSPVNKDEMGPFLFLGFLPAGDITQNTMNGYRANGEDFTFENCDSNPNSYLTLYVNDDNKDPIVLPIDGLPLNRPWIDRSTPVANWSKLPKSYFMQSEMIFGGCGAFTVSGYFNLTDILGAAIGIPFSLVETSTTIPMTEMQHTTEETKDTPCNFNDVVYNWSDPTFTSAIQEKLTEIAANLTVVRNNLTRHRNSKISAMDRRLSATLAGMVGVIVLAIVISAIVMPDVIAALRALFQTLKWKP